MPKIVMQERHFAFLRELVARFLDDKPDVGRDIFGNPPTKLEVEFAEEVLILLGYTRHFKKFAVEIQPDDDDDPTKKV